MASRHPEVGKLISRTERQPDAIIVACLGQGNTAYAVRTIQLGVMREVVAASSSQNTLNPAQMP
eukprot:3251351-Pleurochrysis_carterae.AAC.1